MTSKRELSVTEGESSNKRRRLDVDVDEGNLTMHCTPSPLKELAAMSVSVAIWRHSNIRFYKNRGYAALRYDVRNVQKQEESYVYVPPYVHPTTYDKDKQPLMKPIQDSIDALALPKQISNDVVNQCKIKQRELRLWAHRHQNLISLKSFGIEDILWKANGCVDDLATVRSILSSSKLNPAQKFELMSQYCLEDDMKSLPSSVPGSYSLGKWKLRERFMQYYWKCYFSNTLHTIDLEHSALSLDMFMLLRHAAYANEASFEYFFHRLSNADQVSAAITLCSQADFKFKSIMLSQLTKAQYDQCLARSAHHVIKEFGKFIRYEDYVSKLWLKYKEQIEKTQWNFYLIILELYRCPKVDENTPDHVDRLLFEIWDTATETSRQFMFTRRFNYILFLQTSSRRWEFLLKIYSISDIPARNEIESDVFFIVFCRSLIESHRWCFCDTFIKLCLSSEDRVSQFKAHLMEIPEVKSYCLRLFNEHGTERLDDLLETFLSPCNAILDYKKYLFHSRTLQIDYCVAELRSGRIERLVELIDYIFNADSRKAIFYRINLSVEKKVFDMICQFINNGEFDKTKDLIDRLLVDIFTEGVDIVKTKLVLTYRDILKNGNFSLLKKVEWDKFLSWCSDGGIKLMRELLRVDDVFSKMFKMVFTKKRELEIESRLQDIDCFLRWYFESKNEIDEYKNKMAFEYRHMLTKKINTKSLRGLCVKKLIFGWFFDGNQRLIDEFMVKMMLT
ncbi:uncharacterized protein LOC135847193 isoform X1 [Planococcus citri]|uniref:uncharacterized protein LOC135847193 isoform X1 n=1 Tax=Planococcus citri TaxID=170843 RepID=UPI0031F7EE3C